MRRTLAGITLALVAVVAAHADTLTLYGDHGYPPLMYLDKASGRPAGQLMALLAQAEALTGDRYTVELMPWVRAYQLALRGQGGLVGASRTAGREVLFDFSMALASDDIHVVTRKEDSAPVASLDDLQGKRVGVVRGASYGSAVDNAAAAGRLTLDRDNCQRTQLRRLLLGQLDAVLVGNGASGFDVQWRGYRELESRRGDLLWHAQPLVRSSLHVAVPKALQLRAALDRLDVALARLQAPEVHAASAIPSGADCTP